MHFQEFNKTSPLCHDRLAKHSRIGHPFDKLRAKKGWALENKTTLE